MLTNGQNNILFNFLIQPRFRIWRHIFIIIILSFVSIGQSMFVFGDQAEALGNTIYWYGFFNAVAIIVFFYFNLYFLVPRFLLKNRYVEYYIILLAGTAVYLILKGTVEYLILSQLGIVRSVNIVTFLDGLSNLALYSICIASSSATSLFKQWITDTEKIHALENTQLRSSVDEIKNHINPKSLSGVLTYAAEKVKTDSSEASDVLFRLSDILRYELYDCKREKVLLESDIDFIDKYLSLEQLNSRNRFTYTISVTKKMSLLVPPFIFMPVVQKVLEQLPTDMQIKFEVDNNLVKFSCNVSGTDLTQCDFSKEEQSMSILYGYNIKIDKNVESVKLQLSI